MLERHFYASLFIDRQTNSPKKELHQLSIAMCREERLFVKKSFFSKEFFPPKNFDQKISNEQRPIQLKRVKIVKGDELDFTYGKCE